MRSLHLYIPEDTHTHTHHMHAHAHTHARAQVNLKTTNTLRFPWNTMTNEWMTECGVTQQSFKQGHITKKRTIIFHSDVLQLIFNFSHLISFHHPEIQSPIFVTLLLMPPLYFIITVVLSACYTTQMLGIKVPHSWAKIMSRCATVHSVLQILL